MECRHRGSTLATRYRQTSISGPFDPDADPLTYLWDFGDGQTVSSIVSHAYAYGGAFNVTLTIVTLLIGFTGLGVRRWSGELEQTLTRGLRARVRPR